MTMASAAIDVTDCFGDRRDVLVLCALEMGGERIDWGLIGRAALRFPVETMIAELVGGGCGEISDSASAAADILRRASPGDWRRARRKVDEELAAAAAVGARVVVVTDDDVPVGVRGLGDLPPFVFVRGGLNGDRDGFSVAVVGSRRPSPGGLARAEWATRQLVDAGVTVVSGLAAGIDTAAHRAALDAGGRTIAVTGTGVAHCYPKRNRGLADEIVASGGALIAPFWPTQPSTRWTFSARNRVTVAIAQATLVVDAAERSGSSQTARLALRQQRTVFFPSSLLDQQSWAAELADSSSRVFRVDDAQRDMIDRLVPAARRREASTANTVDLQLL